MGTWMELVRKLLGNVQEIIVSRGLEAWVKAELLILVLSPRTREQARKKQRGGGENKEEAFSR